MNTLIKSTMKRPVTVCILVVVLMAAGVLATMNMSTNLLPNIKMPMLGISVVYPGASAQSVEDGVTSVLEGALQTVAGITDIETTSYDNASVAVLTFDYGTDIDEKISDIEDAFGSITLPDGCEQPSFIKIDMNGTATATISVYNPAGDADALTADANALAKRLNAIEGVGSVDIYGTPERQIRITALNGLDVTALLAVQALSNENLNIPLGTIMQDGSVVAIRNVSDATSLADVMRLPVQLALGSSALGSFAALQQAVRMYAYCTLDEFDGYVQQAVDARSAIDEIEGKSADQLAEQQDGLSAVKSLMQLLRGNSSQSLRLMWHTIDSTVVQNDEFVNMSQDDLAALAQQYDMSYDLLKWVQSGAIDGTLQSDWEALVQFRELCPNEDTDGNGTMDGADLTYDMFAYLFQDGGSVTQADGSERSYRGLDLLHSNDSHAGCDNSCTRETYSHEQAADVCKFADSVNTLAYNDIVETVRTAESNGEQPQISDEQFARLFVNTMQGSDFAALMSPQVIHIIRQDNFNNGKGSIVDVLTESKRSHVNAQGDAVYANGDKVLREEGKTAVLAGGNLLYVDAFGRLTDADGNPVDVNGNPVQYTDEQIAANYYSYGDYIVYTDSELADLYASLGVDVADMQPTCDVIRLLRICQFDDGTPIVPLAYIGHVESYENRQAYAQYNGLMSVTVEVYAVSDANTTDVVDGVKRVIADFDGQSSVILLDDKAQFINDSISNVLSSIVIGGVLAVAVIYLFVRKVGSSLVVSVTMPLSVLVALIGLWAMDISLNLVSLGGLAVGIGMLVDNSIVVLESITKHRDAGESVWDSCVAGTSEVAGSLLASTLTNVCVFFPILFARGLTREIFYDLVWAVLFSIVMSLFVAVTVIPALYNLIYRKPMRPRRKKDERAKAEPQPQPQQSKRADSSRKPRNKKITVGKMENAYGKVLSKVLTQRVWVCVVALVVFGVSVGLVFATGTEFLPGVDKGVIEIDLAFPSSATLDDATAMSKAVADAVSAKYGDSVEYVSLTVGKQGILATADSGVVRIQTDTSELNTEQTVGELRELVDGLHLPFGNVTVREMDGVVAEVTGGMSGQSVELLADNMDVLRSAAAEIADKLRGVEGVASALDNTSQLTKQISFTFDRTLCAKRGVDYQQAVLLLRVGMSGYTAASVNIDGETLSVNVSFTDATQNDLSAITELIVGFDDDGAVRLRDVLVPASDGALYAEEQTVSVISRKNGKFATSIDVQTFGADTGTMGKRINAVVSDVLAHFDGVEYNEGGVAAYLNDAFDGLIVSLIAAFVLLFSVMACQFESLIKPLIVIASIPFSFTGGFLALVIAGQTLNVVSFVGLIMLMGVIVNGAIVMIDKINQLIASGMSKQQAVVEGCKSRLRPILMTTLTTVLALVPLALGFGRGGELMQPMGIVVLGGLLLGTLVTLVLIPCFYCILNRISFKKQHAPNDGEQPQSDAKAAQSGGEQQITEDEQPAAESEQSVSDCKQQIGESMQPGSGAEGDPGAAGNSDED